MELIGDSDFNSKGIAKRFINAARQSSPVSSPKLIITESRFSPMSSEACVARASSLYPVLLR